MLSSRQTHAQCAPAVTRHSVIAAVGGGARATSLKQIIHLSPIKTRVSALIARTAVLYRFFSLPRPHTNTPTTAWPSFQMRVRLSLSPPFHFSSAFFFKYIYFSTVSLMVRLRAFFAASCFAASPAAAPLLLLGVSAMPEQQQLSLHVNSFGAARQLRKIPQNFP